MDESIRRMERALTVISADGPDAEMADLAARLGSAYYFAGDLDRSFDRTEQALEIAESLLLPDVLARSFIVKSFIADSRSRPEESLAFLNQALKVASEHDLASTALRAHYNLAGASLQRDRHEDELEHLAEALALARKNGDRVQEWMTVCEMTYPLYMLGRWEELLPALAEVPEEQLGRIGTLVSPLASVLQIHLHRGELNEASRLFNRFAELDASKEVQARAGYLCGAGAFFRATGRYAEALQAGKEAIASGEVLGSGSQCVKQGFVEAAEAAFDLDERTELEALLAGVESLPPGRRPAYLEAHAVRFRARLADAETDARYSGAARLFREFGTPFCLAVTLLEHGEWLAGSGRPAESERLLREAREIFERLGVRPWLERLDSSASPRWSRRDDLLTRGTEYERP